MLIEPVGEYLLGREAINYVGFLKQAYRSRIQAIVVRTYDTLRRQVKSAEKNIDDYERNALDAFDGKFFFLFLLSFSFIRVWDLLPMLLSYP